MFVKQNKLSFTKLSTYNECGLKYDLHYNQYLRPSQPKSALIFGNSIDEALNVLLETKDLNLAQQKFEDLWNKQIFNKKEIVLSIPGIISFSKSDTDEDLLEINNIVTDNKPWMSLSLKGELILKAYNDIVLPKIKQVIGIQTPIKIENLEGDSIEGKLDIILKWEDDRNLLIDIKPHL